MLDAEATYWREKSEGGGWLLQLRGLIGAASRIAHEVCHSLAPSRPRSAFFAATAERSCEYR